MPNPPIIPKHHPMRKIYPHKDRDAHIRGQKARRRPFAREEDYKPIQQTQQRGHHQVDVSTIRLHEGLPRHLHVLGATRFAEAQIDDAAADPADEARGVGQIDEPVEDDGARAATVEVSEDAEEGGDADGVVQQTVFRARFEDAWRGGLDGEGVEAAAGYVEEAVTGRPHAHNYDGVNDAGEGGDVSVLDADDKGRGTSAFC